VFDHVGTLASWNVLRIYVDLEGFSGFEVVDFILKILIDMDADHVFHFESCHSGSSFVRNIH
jgi:hypothetical protein